VVAATVRPALGRVTGAANLTTMPVSRFPLGWTLGLAAVAFAAGAYFVWRDFDGPRGNSALAAPSPIPVTLAVVTTADFPVYLTGLGVVEPYESVTVSSRVDGEILKVDFKQGQMVKAGDILAEIDPKPYQATLDAAVAKKAQDQSTLANARLDLQRYTVLNKEDSSTRQQLDTQQATVNSLAAQIMGDQASIDSAQTQLTYTTIRSPLAGKAGFRLIDPGNIVHASATTGIVTIVKLQPISVVFTAPEQEVTRINKALAAGVVPVDALSSDGLSILSRGKLAIVNDAIDQTSGDIRMKATFANLDDALWPGLSVSTRLLVQTLDGALVVPVDAVRRGPNGLYAYVMGAGDKVAMRAIEVGPQGDAFAVITKGLSSGEEVVTEGQSRLRDGALARAAPIATPTPAAPAKAP
jgi:multidrug efflux system membrane fusion protein